ncbi:IS3 family transposase [Flavobacterium zhairuonense]|uniref:IS3 family transposase n=1 Tax=Flavobacterium zhairuonense TaxID=2493631 RepID=UPI0010539F32|nr:IS3 family transposase [Flavobacterium zhairuonense]KAF2515038.1 IS3 family transposase [Flavobacterium zhairuonense]
MQKPRKSYTPEFKQKAVELSNRYYSTIRAAHELDTSPENIRRWKGQLEDEVLGKKSKKHEPDYLLQLKKLKKEFREVKMERDILRKAAHIQPGDRLAKFKFVKDHSSSYPVGKICKILGISNSGYYYWNKRRPSNRALRNIALTEQIKIIHEQNKKRYGSPRIARELKASGFNVSEKLVRKLMKQACLKSVFKRKFKSTTDSSHAYPIAENRLDREFTADRENETWVSDITYIRTAWRWLYLTIIMDLFDRKIIGWALSTSMTAENTSISAFRMALSNRPITNNSPLIFHSDRGMQYACRQFVDELSNHKSVTRSMSGKGNCWDNAVAESFFKTLKTELTYHKRFLNKQEAESSISEYIEKFYNINRRHKHLNNLNIFEYQKLKRLSLKKN